MFALRALKLAGAGTTGLALLPGLLAVEDGHGSLFF